MPPTHQVGALGQWIKQRRKALDLTQEELAARVGCAPSSLRHIEAGRLRPSKQLAGLLVAGLGIERDQVDAFLKLARESPATWPSGAATRRAPDADPSAMQDIALLPAHPAPPQRQTHNLPAPRTSFLGRQHELTLLAELLRSPDVRLVTITGPAGVGKTRLALQAAREVLPAFADGVYFVALAALRDPALVEPMIADVFTIQESATRSRRDALLDELRAKDLLLVLDNFEQVIDAALHISDLLTGAAGIKVLTTSRALLDIYGEYEFALQPFVLPAPTQPPTLESVAGCGGVQLFTARARAARLDFRLRSDNAGTIAEICRRLDGLPLAIELAAVRVRSLSPEEILQQLATRLTVLTGGPHDLPARQRTLRQAIAWSYDLLAASEQRLFWRLAVFTGGWTLAAAQAVCVEKDGPPAGADDALRKDLQALVRQSLLIAIQDTSAGGRRGAIDDAAPPPRYAMLETIREYAWERLEASGERATIQERHLAWLVALAQEIESQDGLPAHVAGLQQLRMELDNIRAALAWTLALGSPPGRIDSGLLLAGTLRRLWSEFPLYQEGLRWLRPLLARSAGWHSVGRAKALHAAGYIALGVHDQNLARTTYQECLALWQELGNPVGVAKALHGIGSVAARDGNYAPARAYYERSLAIYRELEDRGGIAAELTMLGEMARAEGDYLSAGVVYAEALAIRRSLGNRVATATAAAGLAASAYARGEYEHALELSTDCLRLYIQTGHMVHVAGPLITLAGCLAARRAPSKAVRILAAIRRQAEREGPELDPADQVDYQRIMAAIQDQLEAEALATAQSEGQAMTLEQAVAYALDAVAQR